MRSKRAEWYIAEHMRYQKMGCEWQWWPWNRHITHIISKKSKATIKKQRTESHWLYSQLYHIQNQITTMQRDDFNHLI